MKTRLRYILVGLLVITPFALSAQTISYQGVLIQNSTPLNGPHTLQLTIYDQPTGGTPLFSESHSGVQVMQGEFDVMIGSMTPIPGSLAFDKQYYLGVAVDNGSELSTRGLFGYVPNAFRAKVADGLSANAQGVVTSLNGKSGTLTLAGGGGTTVNQSGSTITISSSGSGGTGIQGVQNSDGSLVINNGIGPTATIGVALGGITTSRIADGAVTTPKIPDGAITVQKLSTSNAVAGNVLIYNGAGVAWGQPVLGAGAFTTLTSSGNTTLGLAAGTTNTFGCALSASNQFGTSSGATNTFGNTASSNDFGVSAVVNNFGLSSGTNNIGSIASSNYIIGSTFINQNATNNTFIGAGTSSGTIAIGNIASTTNIVGVTTINGLSSAPTNIGTGGGATTIGTGTGPTAIGNPTGTTTIQGTGWSIGNNGFASLNAVTNNGNSTLSSESDATGGGSLVTITGTKTIAIVTGTSPGIITAMYGGAGISGQQLIICNKSSSGFAVTFAGATIATGAASQFVFIAGAWVWVH